MQYGKNQGRGLKSGETRLCGNYQRTWRDFKQVQLNGNLCCNPRKNAICHCHEKVIDYVVQEKKTLYQSKQTEQRYQLISGQDCTPEIAFREFMNTKKQYRKDNGVFFKQYVQSFKPDCGATPEQIHAMGVKSAKSFKGFKVIIATHIDADHWHNHFVVNSVNCETGLKIQINEKDLEQLRNRSDEICQQFGFEVLKPKTKGYDTARISRRPAWG